MSRWEQLERPGPDAVTVGGVELRRRSRVVLHPNRAADVFDVALEGKTAVVEEIVESMEGGVQLAVTVEDDPGRDLGIDRGMGHRFFFAPEEVEPLDDPPARAGVPRVLVAGIGNVFLGDDGFGVEVASRLARSKLPPGVVVEDFGIRGMDLAYALADFEVAVLVDALPRGKTPGTLYLVEPELGDGEVAVEAHGMDPVKVLSLARHLCESLPRVLVVGCEPARVLDIERDELSGELSEPVRASLDEAVRMVESVLEELVNEGKEST